MISIYLNLHSTIRCRHSSISKEPILRTPTSLPCIRYFPNHSEILSMLMFRNDTSICILCFPLIGTLRDQIIYPDTLEEYTKNHPNDEYLTELMQRVRLEVTFLLSYSEVSVIYPISLFLNVYIVCNWKRRRMGCNYWLGRCFIWWRETKV